MRHALREVDGIGHPALWLGAHVGDLANNREEAKARSIAKADAWAPDDVYHQAYEDWKRALGLLPARVEELETAPESPLIVGLASETPLETSITLHYPYGVPVIPGSALKGLARSYARQVLVTREGGASLAKDGDADKTLFGTQEQAGAVTFLDAWWVPGSKPTPLFADVMTPHHMQYYSSKGEHAPTDTEDPTPVGFLHARGSFLVAVACEDEKWRQFAFHVLVAALADWGVGAKTASGYGRLRRTQQAVAAERRAIEPDGNMLARARQFNRDSVRHRSFQDFLSELSEHNEATQSGALRIVVTAVRESGLLREKRRNWPDWLKRFAADCNRHGVNLG